MRTAIIGAGFIADFHASAYTMIEDVKLCAVVDINSDKANELASRYDCKVYKDAEQMLKIEKPELVSICLPTFLHAEFTILSLQYGANVLCEKPFTISLQECAIMAREAENAKRMLMIGQVLRWWPEYVRIAEEIYPIRDSIRTVDSCRLLHSNRSPIVFDPIRGGGALYDIHIHEIDFILSLMGTEIDSLYSSGVKCEQGSWIHMNTLLRYKNGLTVRAEAGNRMPEGFPFTARFRAENGNQCLTYEFTAPINIHKSGKSSSRFELLSSGIIQQINVSYDHGEGAQSTAFNHEIAAFVHGIRIGKNPLPIGETMSVMRLLALIHKSLEHNEFITSVNKRINTPWLEEKET